MAHGEAPTGQEEGLEGGGEECGAVKSPANWNETRGDGKIRAKTRMNLRNKTRMNLRNSTYKHPEDTGTPNPGTTGQAHPGRRILPPEVSASAPPEQAP